MQELNQHELENVAGGNEFAKDIGHAVGDAARWAWDKAGDGISWVGKKTGWW
ncbi:hypothetical protein [Neisseria chenwenguii]|uniref:hypothetical protein n=1 Tax=Neisseria chenwenguii TaxID=1853278 RepID=UPI0012FDBDB9|nr:hypothetical protein [Neisseria chenwenguii]